MIMHDGVDMRNVHRNDRLRGSATTRARNVTGGCESARANTRLERTYTQRNRERTRNGGSTYAPNGHRQDETGENDYVFYCALAR